MYLLLISDVREIDSPVEYAWKGGQTFVSRSSKANLQKHLVQRKEYLEHGSDICRRKFGND